MAELNMTDLVLRVRRPDQQHGSTVLGWKRIGWPSLLPVLERRSLYHQLPEDARRISPELKSKAREVLLKHNLITVDPWGVSEEQVLVENRWNQMTLPGRPTLVMVIKWSDERQESRRLAAQEIADYVQHATQTFPYTFYVEITSAERVNTVYYDFIRDRTLSRQWNDIRHRVVDCLRSMEETRGYLTCLAFQIYGCDPDLSMNPPTVYIAVDDRSDERGWYGVVSAVKDILRAADGLSHVQVHIETTKNDLLSNFD